jgi:hypothetical protein
MGFPGDFPGIILWPEVQRYTTLVAPTLAVKPTLGEIAQPYRIPFAGEYWMFRWPHRRPPTHSSIQTGSPAALSFATPDHFPLQMEAHQRLFQSFDPHCCSKVKLEILNADRYPGTILIALYAIDSDAPDNPEESWGRARVQSVPDLKSDPVKPVREVLEYTIPRDSRIPNCTEFRLIFERAHLRVDKSARVAIDSFILAR